MSTFRSYMTTQLTDVADYIVDFAENEAIKCDKLIVF